MKKFGLSLTSRRKYCIFNFCLFRFSKLLSKILRKNHLFYNGFRRFLGSFTLSQVCWSTNFWLWNEICTKMHFVSLFFLNERNITTSFLMIHSKCTVEQYSNLNSNSMNQPCLNYRPSNTLFLLFRFLIILTRLLSKNWWKSYHFSIQISKLHLKM